MVTLTNKEMIKECRSFAKDAGITFKPASCSIDGRKTWSFVNRKTGVPLFSPMTIAVSYDLVCSGQLKIRINNLKTLMLTYSKENGECHE